jgi:3-oxoadipate enol-lactonase
MPATPPLVLLHGLGTGPEAWAPQIEALGGDRQVLAPAVPLDLDRACAELDALDFDRFDLCGLSWGGLVALRYALDRPERVRRLVVTATFASLPRRLRAFQAVMVGAIRAIPRAPHHMAGPMRAGAAFDVRDRLPGFDVPTLVLCGARDRINLGICRSLAAQLPRGELAIVPQAGHVANLGNPAAFNRLVADFLAH